MGGIGSGRRYHSGAKGTVDSSTSIDIHYLNKKRLLLPGYSGTLSWSRNGRETGSIRFNVTDDELMLSYTSDGQSFGYSIPIVYSSCNYGGRRPWLQCPKCNRRVGKITLNGKMFLCRKCGNLAYQSQRDNASNRLLNKSQMIRKRLGGAMSTLDPIPPRPKGMHYKTYRRLRKEIDQYEFSMWTTLSTSIKSFANKFGTS